MWHFLMWVYGVSKGELIRNDGMIIAHGYSGFGVDKNNPDSERKAGLGPIPRGLYRIGEISDNDMHGPMAFHLWPLHDVEVFGRSGFLCHGDSKESPGAASHGCIILNRAAREEMYNSTDKLLEVIR